MSCRICSSTTRVVLDLGRLPLANRLRDSADAPEPRYPLVLEHCPNCGNLQLGYCVDPTELYDDYLYVTPDSPSLRRHYEALLDFMSARGYLAPDAFLFEFGSNVGRFLESARPRVGRVLGLDPAHAIVERAVAAGIPSICAYFGPETAAAAAAAHGRADAVVARHCAAHNTDAHALVEGARRMLGERGVFVMENAYGLSTVVNREIGQIYHEHMFYFMAQPVQALFAAHGLDLVDLMFAENIHGGSMAFIGAPNGSRSVQPVVAETIARERAAITDQALDGLAAYLGSWRTDTRALLDDLARRGRSVALYGASAKAATFVGAVGIDAADAPICADSTDTKIGKFLPGTGIEIRSEEEAIAARPDYFLITAWNYRDEIIAKTRAAGNTHTGFAVPFPDVAIVEPCALDR